MTRVTGELVAERPVLVGAQIRQGAGPRGVQEHVLVDPTEPGGVGPQRGLGAGGDATLDPRQVLQHPAPGPVEVGAVVEDHVHEGRLEERVRPHRHRSRNLEHLGSDGVGDLVFDDAGVLARVLGLDDDLHVGQVGDGFKGDTAHGQHPAPHHEHRRDEDQETVVNRRVDDGLQHGPRLNASLGPCRAWPPAPRPAPSRPSWCPGSTRRR